MSIRIAVSTGVLTAAGLPAILAPATFDRMKRMGFDWIDLSDIFLAMSELSEADVARMGALVRDAGLQIAGASVIGLTPASRAADAQAFRERVSRAFDNAASLGVSLVSVGLHGAPPGGIAGGARPPWLTQGSAPEHSDAALEAAAGVVAEVADVAARHGQSVHLEMAESSVLDTGASCVRVRDLAGRSNVGINPDLANMVRAPWPLQESWKTTLQNVAPHVEYWHVKNCHRIELENGRAVSTPSGLAEGTIDYRLGLGLLAEAGFDGVIVVEHYGGDVLWFAENARTHLEAVLRDREQRDAATVSNPGK
ncbi:sugar phosphate isomerase/epimerase [Microbacterium sp. LMC-P-041]|uniref:sugar phosphate isomerase/epimerase family protein n=1 Tax=Microbacterium sp. LMC-P-041 TaxID=3040293 RepID=UPI0025539D39|nr:sugar phosphate isomerase/epimerase [Microbacterium sp. LMC-P-041]